MIKLKKFLTELTISGFSRRNILHGFILSVMTYFLLLPNHLFRTETQNGTKMSERENKLISTYYYTFFDSTLKTILSVDITALLAAFLRPQTFTDNDTFLFKFLKSYWQLCTCYCNEEKAAFFHTMNLRFRKILTISITFPCAAISGLSL